MLTDLKQWQRIPFGFLLIPGGYERKQETPVQPNALPLGGRKSFGS
jgi:hypothetical protein